MDLRRLRLLGTAVVALGMLVSAGLATAAPASTVTVPAMADGTQAAPNFKAPFPCNQRWTYSHHSAEVRRALDFIRSDGGVTNGTPNLASAAGVATRHSQPSGAGNYIKIDHGGGWQTYYFHLAAFSVPHGANVVQGQMIGVTGSTGNSSGPHIHYEQLLNGVGQNIRINGIALSYPSRYGTAHLTSDNGCTPPPLTGGTYRITAEVGGYDLDVVDCQSHDGADVRMWFRISTSPCQKWQVTSVDGGNTFKIIDGNTGKGLRVADCSTADATVVQLWAYAGQGCETWRIEPLSLGSYKIIGTGSGKSLDVAGCSSASGADVIIWPSHGGSCQRWYFTAV